MALTTDKIQAAFNALQNGQIPDLGDLREMCLAWERLQQGEPFYRAIRAEGPEALAERDDALRRAALAFGVDTLGNWKVAGLLVDRMKTANLPKDLADAVRLGARRLGQRAVYEVLRADSSGPKVVEPRGLDDTAGSDKPRAKK